jgi:hypothetical protein
MIEPLRVLLTLPLVLAGVAAALLLAPEGEKPIAGSQLECVQGEAAMNETQMDEGGAEVTLPAIEAFSTVEEAEAFVCQELPQAQALDDWRIVSVIALRSHSLDEPEGQSIIEIEYYSERLNTLVWLRVPGRERVTGAGEPLTVPVGEVTGRLWLPGRGLFIFQWTRGGFTYLAHGFLGSGAHVQRDVLPLLETVR